MGIPIFWNTEMGRLGKQPALVIELQEQEKSLVIIPTSSLIEWIDWLVSHRSINTEFVTRDRVDEAFSLICMMFRYILPGPGLLVYMSTLLWLFFIFRLMLETKDLEKGKWQYILSPSWDDPFFPYLWCTWLREALACVQVGGRITAAEQKKT